MRKAIVINSESFGKGDEELGKKLMGAFLRKVWMRSDLPEIIVCYNSGVKILAPDSPVLDALHGLSDKGVEIIACGTCIEFYQMDRHLEIGRVSDMAEIVNIMMEFDKVITV